MLVNCPVRPPLALITGISVNSGRSVARTNSSVVPVATVAAPPTVTGVTTPPAPGATCNVEPGANVALPPTLMVPLVPPMTTVPEDTRLPMLPLPVSVPPGPTVTGPPSAAPGLAWLPTLSVPALTSVGPVKLPLFAVSTSVPFPSLMNRPNPNSLPE